MSLLYKSPKFLSKRTKKTKPEVQRFLISRVNCDTNNIFCSAKVSVEIHYPSVIGMPSFVVSFIMLTVWTHFFILMFFVKIDNLSAWARTSSEHAICIKRNCFHHSGNIIVIMENTQQLSQDSLYWTAKLVVS